MAMLSIRSLLDLGVKQEDILVYSDSDRISRRLGVCCQHMSSRFLKCNAGRLDFNHRIKLAILRLALENHSERSILYSDSDTYWVRLPSEIAEGHSLMNDKDWDFSPIVLDKYIRALVSSGYQPSKQMLNAGIIGLPAGFNPRHVTEMIRLTDILTMKCSSRIEWCEQMAVSEVLCRQTTVAFCPDRVIHYWAGSYAFLRATNAIPEEEFINMNEMQVRKHLHAAATAPHTLSRLIDIRYNRFKRSIRKRRNSLKGLLLRLRNMPPAF
jgi:hypothetical protein